MHFTCPCAPDRNRIKKITTEQQHMAKQGEKITELIMYTQIVNVFGLAVAWTLSTVTVLVYKKLTSTRNLTLNPALPQVDIMLINLAKRVVWLN